MSRKKRFTISSSLNRGLAESINAVKNNMGAIRFEAIPLTRIELDPENPRNLHITPEEIINDLHINNNFTGDKLIEFEKLRGLAETIKRKGLINPVVVYKYGEKYRLVAGERRYLASLIASKDDIQARVLTEKPSGLRLLQWIENTEREDLTLKDRLGNVRAIVDEYKKENQNAIISATIIKDLLSITIQQASCYMSALNAPNDVIELINSGLLNNLDKVAALARIENTELRAVAIQAFLKGQTIKEIKSIVNTSKKNVMRGKKLTQINLGTTNKSSPIKKIVNLVISCDEFKEHEQLFTNIDWSSAKQVSKAFQLLLNLIEQSENK